jgi:protein involved in polysaccharide export with SLBB domain
LVVLALAAQGCAHRPPPAAAPATAAAVMPPDERIGIDDVIHILVVGEKDLTEDFRVSGDGTIDFPFVGRVVVAGSRSGELQQLITKKLSEGYIRNPQVSVMIREWNSRKIAVLGQVQKPGTVSYRPGMTIVEAIASAGGFTAIASKNSVTLRREVSGQIVSHVYPVADISEGHGDNVTLHPGDVLVVEERLF